MKKLGVFLFLVVCCVLVYFGCKNRISSSLSLPRKKVDKEEIQEALKQPHPLLVDRKIVAVVCAENNGIEVERNLNSLFNQTYPHYRIVYIDNGSTDGTLEKVREQSGQRQLEVIRCEQKKPILEVLYSLISQCDPNEIVALIDGKDWLFHEHVFEHLNAAYANPDVWMTYSRAISHPDYQEIQGEPFSDTLFLEKHFRKQANHILCPLLTFYAGLFQKIKLQDLLYQGKFVDPATPLAIQLPLIEMSPNHVLFMNEVTYVSNREKEGLRHQMQLKKMAAIESHLRSSPCYPTLSHFSLGNNGALSHRYKADVILFSEDTPLHLYACLESIFENIKDVNEVYVLYKESDQEFQRAYLNVQHEFQTVHFFNVCEYPGNDCATLITKALENKNHACPFVLFGTDEMVFEEKIALHDAIDAMEKVHANFFLLSLEEKETGSLPATIPVSQGIHAFQLGVKGSHSPLVFSLCRKNLFQDVSQVENFPAFKKFWQKKLSPVDVALFYEEKKTFAIHTGSELSSFQKKEWGYRFIEGFKIDLQALFCEIQAVEKGTFPLIKREKRSMHCIQD